LVSVEKFGDGADPAHQRVVVTFEKIFIYRISRLPVLCQRFVGTRSPAPEREIEDEPERWQWPEVCREASTDEHSDVGGE
jgi:hypothetical protein